MSEINYAIEGVYWLGQMIFLSRTVYHAKVSNDEKRSVTPITFWILAVAGNLFIGLYGFLIGSISMPLFALLSIPISIYHIHIEKKRIKGEQKNAKRI